LHDAHNLSFPSGHATAAFALAAVLAFHCRKTRWFMVPLAAACAFSRIVMEAHFYSDIVAGGVLGWTAGWFAARGMQAIVRRLAPAAANV
jgi:undecaprenyl-diphosphatase